MGRRYYRFADPTCAEPPRTSTPEPVHDSPKPASQIPHPQTLSNNYVSEQQSTARLDALATHIATTPKLPSSEPIFLEPIILRDGGVLTVRSILPSDHDALFIFHESLSPNTIHERFHGALPHLTEPLLQRFTRVDFRSRVAFVALTSDETKSEHIVAVARYDRNPAQPDNAEYAIVVSDAYQNLGIGKALLKRLLDYARTHGVRVVIGEILAENARMERTLKHVAEQLGMRFEVVKQSGLDEVDECRVYLE